MEVSPVFFGEEQNYRGIEGRVRERQKGGRLNGLKERTQGKGGGKKHQSCQGEVESGRGGEEALRGRKRRYYNLSKKLTAGLSEQPDSPTYPRDLCLSSVSVVIIITFKPE